MAGIDISGDAEVMRAFDEVQHKWGGEAAWLIGSDKKYAAIVEMGAGNQMPQPYLVPSVISVMENKADSIVDSASSIDDALEKIANEIHREAERRVPVRTGELRMSLEVVEIE